MSGTFSTATLGLGIDTSQFNTELRDVGKNVTSVLDNMKLRADAFSDKWGSMTEGIKDTKRIVSGILVSQGFYALSNVLVDAAAGAFAFTKNMETANISMEYFVKGADKAAKSAAFLRTMNTFAARTPFSTEEAISLSKYMQAVGVSMGVTKSFLEVITDTAAATGATEENLQRIVFGLGQMKTKGRLANEEIRQLANANIPIYEILQEQLGLTGEQISNIGNYWVDADKAVAAILRGLEERYEGAADRIADTFTGMTDTIKDNMKIITQVAGAGGFEMLKGSLTTLRDMLDLYRQIASEGVYVSGTGRVVTAEYAAASQAIEQYYAGSAGLFDYILRQIDSTGQLGTAILSVIGNTRNLGQAFVNLYMTSKGVIDLFGTSFYVSLSVVEVTLTSMIQIVEGVIKGLGTLGITTGELGKALAALVIAYKAAQWLGLLGQAASAAGYAAYQSSTAMLSMLPASLQARTGVVALTASLATMVAYAIAAFGIFQMINSSMAGLDTDSDGLFPSDYEAQIAKYSAEMEKYNAAIAKYQEGFEQPFSSIDTGAEKATKGIEDIEKASGAAAKAVKNDWLAAFDEVYAPPKDNGSGGGGKSAIDDLLDLGAMLIPPAFKFPEVKGNNKLPEVPVFDMGKVYNVDMEPLDSSWWYSMIPILGSTLAINIGKVIAKNKLTKEGKTGTGETVGKQSLPFQDSVTAGNVLKQLTDKFTKDEQTLKQTLAALDDKNKAGAERLLLEERLMLQETALRKQQLIINEQAAIAGRSHELLASSVLERATKRVRYIEIERQLNTLIDLDAKRLDTGTLGDAARQDFSKVVQQLDANYTRFIKDYGTAGDLALQASKFINIEGLDGRVSGVLAKVDELVKLAEKDSTALVVDDISNLQRTLKGVLQEATDVGADTAALVKSQEKLVMLSSTAKKQAREIASLDTYNTLEQKINDLVNVIKYSPADMPARDLAVEQLRQLTADLKAVETQLNKQYIRDGEALRLASDTFDKAEIISEEFKIDTLLSRLDELNKSSKLTNEIGDAARQEITAVKKQLVDAVNNISSITGLPVSPEIKQRVSGVVNVTGIEGRITALTKQVEAVAVKLIDTNFNVSEVATDIAAVKKIGSQVARDIRELGITSVDALDALSKLDNISKYQTLQFNMLKTGREITRLDTAVKEAPARRALGQPINTSSLKDSLDTLIEQNRLSGIALADTAELIRLGIAGDKSLIIAKQQELAANLRLEVFTTKLRREVLSSVVVPLKAIEKYGAENFSRANALPEAEKLIGGAISQLQDFISANQESKALTGSLNTVIANLRIAGEGSAMSVSSDDAIKQLLAVVTVRGNKSGASIESIDKAVTAIATDASTLTGYLPKLDKLLKKEAQLGKKPTELSFESYASQRLQAYGDTVKNIKTLEKDITAIIEGTAANYKSLPANVEKIKANLAESFKEAITEEHNKRMATKALQTAVDKIAKASETSIKLQKQLVGEVAPAPAAGALGETWQRAATTLDLKTFKPGGDIVSSSDLMALIDGQTAYGNNIARLLINGLSENTKSLFKVAGNFNTHFTQSQIAFAGVAKDFLLPIIKTRLAGAGYEVTHGTEMVSADGLVKGKVDGFALKNGDYIPVDIHSYNSFDKRIAPVIMDIDRGVDGLLHLTADKFEKLIDFAPDLAGDIAAKAYIAGKDHMLVGILNASAAEIPAGDTSGIEKYNPVTQAREIRLASTNRAKDIFAGKYLSGKLDDFLTIIDVAIPDGINGVVEAVSKGYSRLNQSISLAIRNNVPAEEIAELFRVISSTGEALGDVTNLRYESAKTKVPRTGISELNEVLRNIDVKLRSTEQLARVQGIVELDSLTTTLKQRIPERALDEVIVTLRQLDDGSRTGFKTSGKRLLELISKVDAYREAIVSLPVAQRIQFADLLAKNNMAFKKGLGINDVAYTDALGNPRTVADIQNSIASMSKSIPGTDKIRSTVLNALQNTKAPAYIPVETGIGDIKVWLEKADALLQKYNLSLPGTGSTIDTESLRKLFHTANTAQVNIPGNAFNEAANTAQVNIPGNAFNEAADTMSAASKNMLTAGNMQLQAAVQPALNKIYDAIDDLMLPPGLDITDELISQLRTAGADEDVLAQFIAAKGAASGSLNGVAGTAARATINGLIAAAGSTAKAADDIKKLGQSIHDTGMYDAAGNPTGTQSFAQALAKDPTSLGYTSRTAVFGNAKDAAEQTGVMFAGAMEKSTWYTKLLEKFLGATDFKNTMGVTYATKVPPGGKSVIDPDAVKLDPGFSFTAKDGKEIAVSFSKIAKVVDILGVVGEIAAIGIGTKSARDAFDSTVIPALTEEQKQPAYDRATLLSLGTGWDAGMFGGVGVGALLKDYGEMAEAERLFWTKQMAQSSFSFSMFDSNQTLLKDALWNQQDVDKTTSWIDIATGKTDDKTKDIGKDYQTFFGKLFGTMPTDMAEANLADAMEKGINNSDLAKLVDYMVLSGDTESNLAKDFYKLYTPEMMSKIVLPEYGLTDEVASALEQIASSTDEGSKAFMDAVGMAGVSYNEMSLATQITLAKAISEIQDSVEGALLPGILAQSQNSQVGSPLEGDYARAVTGVDASKISDSAAADLKNVLGISFENISSEFAKLSIDSEAISDNITGWVTRLPETISLDGTSLSVQDVAILASAGIQINGDGTVTFMKAMNENVTGTERTVDLTISSVSGTVLAALEEAGLSFDFSAAEPALNLSLAAISENMRSAMFILNETLSAEEKELIASLGTVLESGYIDITNTSIISGEQSVREYLEAMGVAFDENGNYIFDKTDGLSQGLIDELLRIDAIIAQGGEATKETVASWAEGITMPSPISAEALDEEMRAAFAAIGITFEQSGEEFLMVINRVGNNIKDGMVLIPTETWDKLNDDIITALVELGVSTKPTAAGVMVDISGTMESGIGDIIELFTNRPDLWNQLPQAIIDNLEAAGVEADNGMIRINTAMLNSMVNLGTEWYAKWSMFSPEVVAEMDATALATEEGLLKIEEITANTTIPDDLNTYVVKPFSELPDDIKEKLTGGDASVTAALEGSEFLITGATETAFAGAVTAVQTSFATMATDAATGAQGIAEAVAKALLEVEKFKQIDPGWSGSFTIPVINKQVGGTPNTKGTNTVTVGGITYVPIYDDKNTLIHWAYIDKTGKQQTTKNLGYATGGIIATDGLYRAGEFGKKEGIIPLENRHSLSMIGHAIGNTMAAISTPVQKNRIMQARGLYNGGIAEPTQLMQRATAGAGQPFSSAQFAQQSQQILHQATRPVVYVYNMIADKQGLRELNEKLEVVKLNG